MNNDSDNPSPNGFFAVPPGDPPRAHFDTPWGESIPLADVLAPTWTSLRVERGAPAGGARCRPEPEVAKISHALPRHSRLLTRLAGGVAPSRSRTRLSAPPRRIQYQPRRTSPRERRQLTWWESPLRLGWVRGQTRSFRTDLGIVRNPFLAGAASAAYNAAGAGR
jgi:hypothetical protein